MQVSRPFANTLCALSVILVSCLGHGAFAQDPAAKAAVGDTRVQGAAMQRALAKLPPECSLGNARDADGAWVNAAHSQGVPSAQIAQEHALAAPVNTHVVRVAMDREGWKLLDKVEVRDAGGQWHLAWSGAQPAAPAGCDYVWFKHALATDVRVGAVRLVFRRENGSFMTGNVGVLKTAQ